MNLFQLGSYKLASGIVSGFKIDCDALTDSDWDCLAYLGSCIISPFGSVAGVPRGGLRFARALSKYSTTGPRLIVDDVFTTGRSIRKFMDPSDYRALVAFARVTPPYWIQSVFNLSAGIQ